MRLLDKIEFELQNLMMAIDSLFFSSEDKIENKVPYVSQFANPEFAEKILRDNVEKTSDPDWKSTGAETREEYAEWVLNICGMACTAMVLQYFEDNTDGIITLAKDAMDNSVYKKEFGEISDMHYKAFVKWIESYEIQAKIYTRLTVRSLHKLISDGKLVIVSVNPNIRGYKTVEHLKKGGHLVLITGYDKNTNTITLHNPSGFVSSNTQKNYKISVPEFSKYYAGRGIALSKLQ